MVKVSVIVPVYNVENYLNECLDSVINQSFRDIEIICINDGSTDNSLSIIKEFASQDNRIKIIDQKNKGLGAARNAGLDIANGEYILFVDSDDYLDINTLDELVSYSTDYSLDLLIFKLLNFDDETGKIEYDDYHEMPYLKTLVGENVFNYKDILDFVIDIDVTVYTKFFKRSLISQIRFNEDLIFEDNLFTMEYIFKAERCLFLDKHFYHRRVRSNSIITKKSKNYVDVIEIFNRILECIKKYGLYGEFKEKLFRRKIQAIFLRYSLIDNEFKQYFFEKIKSDFISKKDEYYDDINFDLVDPRFKLIFDSAIESDTHEEFELEIQLYDLTKEYGELKGIKKQLSNKNKALKMDSKKSKNECDSLLESNSWKITKPLRYLKHKF